MSELITNEPNTMSSKLKFLLDYTKTLDCLVGYFYLNGFKNIIDSLDNVDHIKILVGMGVTHNTMNYISRYSMRNIIENKVKKDLDSFEDTKENSDFIIKLNKFFEEKKIEIHFYNKQEKNLHAKMYIFNYNKSEEKNGSIIIGSSNFSYSGLNDNYEMNVLLEDNEDYIFGKKEFDKLWDESDDYTEVYCDYIKESFILNNVTPYDFYIKFIYEFYKDYFDESCNLTDLPKKAEKLQYQLDAVYQAKRIINEHGGVFLSDVVGLGKTYMGAMLLSQLPGKSLIIAPPHLLDISVPGSWKHVLNEFYVDYDAYSNGKIKNIYESNIYKDYDNILIDESHIYRNVNKTYNYLKKICQGKKVILISATPFNNNINDLLNQIKLFQNPHKSTLPHNDVKDLDKFFKNKNKELKASVYSDNYGDINTKVNQEIREKILKYLMVRRTRDDIKKYYPDDLKNNQLAETRKPVIIPYELKGDLSSLFDETYKILANKLTYARYIPLSHKYFIKTDNKNTNISLAGIIKTLLFKRLESDVSSFKKSIENLILVHEKVIQQFEDKKIIYTGKNISTYYLSMSNEVDINKIENDLRKNKAKKYSADNFNDTFYQDLKKDLNQLKIIQEKWQDIDETPKINKLISHIQENHLNSQIVIFTEYIDTADYLNNKLNEAFPGKVIEYTGNSSHEVLKEVKNNFDANLPYAEDKLKYKILISTDVLSHGVNLHRANVLINYDIPWNPTKVMQRLGRLQRLHANTKKKPNDICVYSFFPTDEIDNQINLIDIVKNKLNTFITLLGADQKYLGIEDLKHNDGLSKIIKPNIKEYSIANELKYVNILKKIKKEDYDSYIRAINLPNKTRIRRLKSDNNLISLYKINNFNRIIKTDEKGVTELTFEEAIKSIKASKDDESLPITDDYYDKLKNNTKKLREIIYIPTDLSLSTKEKQLLNKLYYIIYNETSKTDYHNYFKKVIKLIKMNYFTNSDIKEIYDKIKTKNDPTRIYNIIKEKISKDIENLIIETNKKEDKIEFIMSQQSTTE